MDEQLEIRLNEVRKENKKIEETIKEMSFEIEVIKAAFSIIEEKKNEVSSKKNWNFSLTQKAWNFEIKILIKKKKKNFYFNHNKNIWVGFNISHLIIIINSNKPLTEWNNNLVFIKL